MINRVDNGWIVIGDDCPIVYTNWDFVPEVKTMVSYDLAQPETETKTANTEMSDDEAFDLMDSIRKEMRQE